MNLVHNKHDHSCNYLRFQFLKYLLYSISRILSDKTFIELKFRLCMGCHLDLDHPKTYNEKLQWLKLYDRKPEYTNMVDKVEAKEYVANIIGGEHVIPTLGVYDRPEDIDFGALPDQFVLKTTHDSGGVFICRDKQMFDKADVIKKLKKRLKRNVFWYNREWPYKNVKPRIIVEKYVTDDGEGLKDYKFFCFNGNPKVMFVLKDRAIDTRLNFYDMDFNKLPFERGYPNFEDEIDKPEGWDEMINLSKQLSKDLPHVRVDFYSVNGIIYVGELTFFPGSGMEVFNPKEWDLTLGEWIGLPKI